MTNNTDAAIAFALIVAATAVAAALVAGNTYADDFDKTPLVSTLATEGAKLNALPATNTAITGDPAR